MRQTILITSCIQQKKCTIMHEKRLLSRTGENVIQILNLMGQGTARCPTMKAPIKPHRQGARNSFPRALFFALSWRPPCSFSPAPGLQFFPLSRPTALSRLPPCSAFPPRKILFTLKRIFCLAPVRISCRKTLK